MLDSARQDARYAARGLARSPVFSLTAILSIAIGVGGTAAIYSLANALLLSAPSGVGNPDQLRTNEDAIGLIREFASAGKPVAAICHGPWLLVEADLLRGKRATSWKSIRTDLRNAGAEVVDEEVVTDGNIITSRKPDDVPAFTEAVIEAMEAMA